MTNNTPDYEDNLYFDSQNTKNEQQKDLCITSEQLTEQWKKGELPEGWYYIKCDDGICFDRFTYYGGFSKIFNYSVKQILAPVPSYDEWFKIKNLASLSECLQEKNIECLHRENELKEILERHKKATAKAQIRSYDLEIINVQLKELLKEWVQFETEENPNDFTVMSERMSELGNKTKEALK